MDATLKTSTIIPKYREMGIRYPKQWKDVFNFVLTVLVL